jgi:hypothetical protein
MIRISEEEFNELNEVLNGYCDRLNELEITSSEYSELKWELDNRFCGLKLWQEEEMIHSELDIGNTIIEDDTLTCIYNNKLHKFKMSKRKANNGEYAYIVNATESTPFSTKYIGRCFKVGSQPTKEMLEWVHDYVSINIEGLDYGWCLYDDQYVVLEEIL